MPKAQREKGKRGEREVRDLLNAWGFEARRDGRLDDDLAHNVEGFHFEVKRRETLALPAWTKQAEDDAGPHRVPVVVYRRSTEPWRCSLPFEALLALLELRREKTASIIAQLDPVVG